MRISEKRVRGFTLIELLVVIGVLAVLSTITVIVLNPAEKLAQTRDAKRISELQNIARSLDYLNTRLSISGGALDGDGPLYSDACLNQSDPQIFVSVPSNNGETSPQSAGGYTINRVLANNSQKIDGNGWLPVDLLSNPTEAPLSRFPVDPVNTFASDFYYRYACAGYSYEIDTKFESQAYQKFAQNDGGNDPALYEIGSVLLLDLSLASQAPGTITISVDPSGLATIFDYSTDRCNFNDGEWDLPDVVPHAIRDTNGNIVLGSGNAPHNYFMYGNSFSDLSRDCPSGPVLSAPSFSPTQPNTYFTPEAFYHQQWITSLYRIGSTIYGLVHNEYHDPRNLSQGGEPTPCTVDDVLASNRCWYNSINLVKSSDNGRTFTSQYPASHVIAYPNVIWNPFAKPKSHPPPAYNPPVHGYMEPSNIIQHTDGYYYSAFAAFTSPQGGPANTGTCLMRTDNLDDPSSWRAWNGSSFSIVFTNPYAPQEIFPCAFIDKPDLGDLHQSLTFNTYLNKYVMIGSSHTGTANSCGVYFSTSDDLIDWSPKKQILDLNTGLPWTASMPFSPCSPGTLSNSYGYPSLIDHNSPDINFEKSGNQAFLYITHFHDDVNGPDRDLIRMPLLVCETGVPAPGCP